MREGPWVDRPVFVIGTGRSGTSLFFQMLAFHPDLSWFSNYSHRLPRQPRIAFLSRVHDTPVLRSVFRPDRRISPRPTETYRVLNYCTDSTFTAQRLLRAEDVTPIVRQRFRTLVADYVRLQGKKRFTHKHTGFARISYLGEIFPDSLFIHVHRDGRAVAASMKNVDWWSGDLDSWWWGEMNPAYMEEYLASNREPIVLAGIVWKTLMALIEEECEELPAARLLRVRYDELIRDPSGTMEQVRQFCDLRQADRFEAHVRGITVTNMDVKWKKTLTAREQDLLQACIGEHLERFGFR